MIGGPMTAGISVFSASSRSFERYLGDPDQPNDGRAQIARLVGKGNSNSLAGGVVIYERITVDWDLSFDEMITVIEGSMIIRSAGVTYNLVPGDVAWFPAHTPLTYDVPDRVVVSYAIWPQP